MTKNKLFEGEMYCPQCDSILEPIEDMSFYRVSLPDDGLNSYDGRWIHELTNTGDYACYFCSWVWTAETVEKYQEERLNVDYEQARQKFKEADDTFQASLVAQFGETKATEMRYVWPKDAYNPNTLLAYTLFQSAREVWERAIKKKESVKR